MIVRQADPLDARVIVEFNRRLALETESKELSVEQLLHGVTAALNEPDSRIRYWIAEAGEPRRAVAQAGVTREWSDWRNGWLWWLQSVYVDDAYRGQGIFRALFETIRAMALADPETIGLRLYVEDSNEAAQGTYLSLGMRPGGYQVFEQLWTDRSGND